MSVDLDIFSVTNTDLTLIAQRLITVRPQNVPGLNPVTFLIPSSENYTLLDQSYFTLQIRLPTAGNNGWVADALGASDQHNSKWTYALPNFVHSLFSNVAIEIDGMLYTPNSRHYPWKAFFQKINGNFTKEELETSFAGEGPVYDCLNQGDLEYQAGGAHADSDVPEAASRPPENSPLRMISAKFHGNEWVYFQFKILDPLFYNKKVWPPSTKIKVDFYFNQPEFFLLSLPARGAGDKNMPTLGPDDVRMEFKHCQITLNDDTYRKLQQKRQSTLITYPFVNWGGEDLQF